MLSSPTSCIICLSLNSMALSLGKFIHCYSIRSAAKCRPSWTRKGFHSWRYTCISSRSLISFKWSQLCSLEWYAVGFICTGCVFYWFYVNLVSMTPLISPSPFIHKYSCYQTYVDLSSTNSSSHLALNLSSALGAIDHTGLLDLRALQWVL